MYFIKITNINQILQINFYFWTNQFDMHVPVRIFIVDDHEIFRKGLVMVINKFGTAKVIAEASDGAEFLEKIRTVEADVVLMDIQMPVMNGIEATQKVLNELPNLKIIALSMYGEEKYLQSMIESGAHGFLLKNINKDKLRQAIETIASGGNYFSEELLSFFTTKYISNTKKENAEAKFTTREIEVLNLIAKGLTDKEIGEKLFISERTVNGHRANLIAKTGSRNTVNLLVYAIKNKLVIIENS